MYAALRLLPLIALAVFPSRAIAEEEGKPDPWAVPTPDLAEFLLTLQESERGYLVTTAEKVPDSARRPEAVPAETLDEVKALRACRSLLEGEKWSEAAASLKTLLKKNPALHEARTLLGVVLLRRKKPREAAVALRDALIGHRRNPEAWKALDEVAAALGKKVHRPDLQPRCWLAPGPGDDVEIGFVTGADGTSGDSGTPVWGYYAMARACYRYEGGYAADFPGEPYRVTFRETLNGVGAVLLASKKVREAGEKLPADLDALLAEKKAGTLVPFVFFALHTEPVPTKEEKGFDLLRPKLVKYFDENILVDK